MCTTAFCILPCQSKLGWSKVEQYHLLNLLLKFIFQYFFKFLFFFFSILTLCVCVCVCVYFIVYFIVYVCIYICFGKFCILYFPGLKENYSVLRPTRISI